MRVAIVGRTHWLIDTAAMLAKQGHVIALVATSDAAPEYSAGSADFAALAAAHAAPFHQPVDINEPAFAAALTQAGVEVAVSINWPKLIGETVCLSVPRGFLNAHAGDLPRYRGNACPNWAILNGEAYVGLCVHAIEPDKLDSGPIYARASLSLDNTTYIGDVYAFMNRTIPTLFLQALERMAEPHFTPEAQDVRGVLPMRCHPRRPSDAYLDFRWDADVLLRLIRASSRPFAGAFAFLEGAERVIVWRAQRFTPLEDVLAVPGQIMGRGRSGGVVVACGRGFIEIEEAERGNGGRLPAANAYRFAAPSLPK